MPQIRDMLCRSELMDTFKKFNNRSLTLGSRKKAQQKRHELRRIAHRLNRKGLIPPRLNHQVKAADSFEDTDAIDDEDSLMDEEEGNDNNSQMSQANVEEQTNPKHRRKKSVLPNLFTVLEDEMAMIN